MEQGEAHQQAKAFDIRIGDTMVFQCSACEVKSSREMDIRRHVSLALQICTRHKNGAAEQLIKRFTLEPSGSSVRLITPVSGNDNHEEPDVNQVTRRPANRRRRRSRGRGRHK